MTAPHHPHLPFAFLLLAAFSTCGGVTPKPLPDLPSPEYEPGRSIDLSPKGAASTIPSAAPPSAPAAPPPAAAPKG